MIHTAVVGGGPAGLRAAQVLAERGCRVTLFEQKPSVGRKFLVAGRGGLNLTHSEELPAFVTRYGEELPRWRELLAEFGPAELRAWAADLGVETYVGTSGRVFPRGQQAAVLLRRWVARLREMGVEFHVNRRLAGLRALTVEEGGGWQLIFVDTRSQQEETVMCAAVILALGGASWPQTGSDGRWPSILQEAADGVAIAPWQPANCGWEVAWDPHLLAAAEGLPLKNLAVCADDGGPFIPGEALITRYGLEGGTLYQLGRRLRAMGTAPRLIFDFKPSAGVEDLLRKLPGKKTAPVTLDEAAAHWRLGAGAKALLEFHGPGGSAERGALAAAVKAFALPLRGPRPIAEAISSAGGLAWAELTDSLMLRRLPGVFLAGEMIDWEAPTGGYLLQGCFATGTRAGWEAADFARGQISSWQ